MGVEDLEYKLEGRVQGRETRSRLRLDSTALRFSALLVTAGARLAIELEDGFDGFSVQAPWKFLYCQASNAVTSLPLAFSSPISNERRVGRRAL